MAKSEDEPEKSEPPMVEQLRRAIRASGRSLNQISRDCQVDPSRLSRFLRGQRTITLDAAGRICVALGIELNVPEELQREPQESPSEVTPPAESEAKPSPKKPKKK
ncbi:helix-turn-helix domain-containing protein [Gemmata massiliana]|uniref:helix-turn-helix domain-containing protein n=1 Tax=Gemmata massiliana TaxID=1210884 RepID=UPI0013A6D659|nr:helix-turn-helix transcriptional regulator [Gemmata massiliana]